MANDGITLEPLKADDWEGLKKLRLQALQERPDLIATTYEWDKFKHDKERNQLQWQAFIASDKFQIFGLFDGDQMVGTTAIQFFLDRKGEAEFIMSYIVAEYRNRGLYDLFFEKRIAWCKDNDVKTIIVGHVEGNELVRNTILKHGFQYDYQEDYPPEKEGPLVGHKYRMDL